MIAATKGNERIIRLLLEHGADLALKDADGLTALAWAKKTHRDEVAKMLQQAAASKRKGETDVEGALRGTR
jgi:ankyrin repeat protein